ncbi:serine palmitoyltransferase [Eremomyces bilateralis CBS 781.70]|uniref:serine C-palmitoyltransferase n=1 Tax=Eremomyces bilateralis CBS 781.70 TaxID=1392243 RepID=A0A6G1FZ58_9PEZI|nr:serine palmitoyltransferase [Eremomyces bilateralis CBS 781.70]KAF1811155.1 serine palmitoyltransferase [Eremomyces bilateralis CBS 781.70]
MNAFLQPLGNATTSDLFSSVSTSFSRVPGSAIIARYIRSSYQDDPVRSAVELFLFLFALRYIISPRYGVRGGKKGGGKVELRDDEIEDLVEEWTPEPLVGELTEAELSEEKSRVVIVGQTGPKVKLSTGKTVTNLASLNFYNFVGSEILKERAIHTLRTYGVGPCGPPGFYGHQDVHIKTEHDVATHLGTAACIIYAQAFSTISSVIPAFSKRGDIIVADKAVNYSIRRGLQISRSQIKWFEHNDMKDLERVLKEVVKNTPKKAPLTRRFIVTEALFESTGDVIDLPKIVDLKFQYKFRLILDESLSYGTLGLTGRGITEAQNVDSKNIDMIVGSLSGPLCGGGGFCAGSNEVVVHQRINAASYCFSAALPALLATTASETIALLQTEEGAALMDQARELSRLMRAQLDPRSEWLKVMSKEDSPYIIAVLKNEAIEAKKWSHADQEAIMQDIVDDCLNKGVLITKIKRMPSAQGASVKDLAKEWQPQPALKICVVVGLTKKELESAGREIRHAAKRVINARK